jgi:zinc-binding alcohol dehydrogenase family protein
MKAMVLPAVGPIEDSPLRWRDMADPAPGPGQVVVKVSACGVCRSNLHMIEGDWLPGTPASFPIVPGHEVIGYVAQVGPGVGNVSRGDRVGVAPIWSACGVCRFCLSGTEQLCLKRQITGETRDGGYAELMLADAAFTYLIPGKLADAEAAPLLCPGLTAYGAVKKACLAPGHKVGVVGIGGVGHVVIQIARLAGADVYAVTRNPLHQAVAEEVGAVASHAPHGHEGTHLPDGSLDSAIVFAPSAAAVAEALRLTRRGGRIVLGVSEPVGRLDVGDEKTILGTVLGNRQDVHEVLALAAAGKLRSICDQFPLNDANHVLGQLKAGRLRARAVLVPLQETHFMTANNDVADVLVVGGGTAAGVAAAHLASAGFRVVCLEQGDWVDHGALPGNKPEYEILGDKPWHPDPNVRANRADYPIDNSASDVAPWMFNGVGGTSVLYGAIWARPLPSDFRVRTLDGVADDWPVSYAEMQPYYEAMEIELGVSGLPGNPAYPPSASPPTPAFPLHRPGRRMAEAMNRLGWHWWPGYNAMPTLKYRLQNQCVRYGVCRMGCPEGAKASADVTLFPLALRHGAKIVTRARVARITTNTKGLATGAVYLQGGADHFQAASVVILAAGGIGTPRLLLLSTSKHFPDGLANSSGLVGKRLMMHPYATSVGLYNEELEDWLGPAGEYLSSMHFYETDRSRGFVRGAKWALMPTGGPLETVWRWTHGEDVREEPFWGTSFASKMKESIGHMMRWDVIPEDLPEETNHVTLHPSLTDPDRLPAPQVHYRVSDNTRKMVSFHLARTMEAHEAAGATRAWVAGRFLSSGHITGTAKMGNDPATSVVDRYGRAHDVPNLYLIDGSVFPTSTGVNVAATICANARRIATHLISNARRQVVPA